MEIFKDIEGYVGIYQISNKGRVKTLERYDAYNRHLPEKIKSTRVLPNGYERVHLSKEGVNKDEYVHRLVAKTFIPNPNNFEQVNHINGIKTDNSVENLEWATQSMNVKHSYDQLGHKRSKDKRKFPIICISNGKRYESILEAARELKINHGNLSKHLRGDEHYKNIKGLVFKRVI